MTITFNAHRFTDKDTDVHYLCVELLPSKYGQAVECIWRVPHRSTDPQAVVNSLRKYIDTIQHEIFCIPEDAR